jgi:hypothetical protein
MKTNAIHSALVNLDPVLSASLLLQGIVPESKNNFTSFCVLGKSRRYSKYTTLVNVCVEFPGRYVTKRYNMDKDQVRISLYWQGLDYSDYYTVYESFYTDYYKVCEIHDYALSARKFSSKHCLNLLEQNELYGDDYESNDDYGDCSMSYLVKSTNCPEFKMAQRFLTALLSEL